VSRIRGAETDEGDQELLELDELAVSFLLEESDFESPFDEEDDESDDFDDFDSELDDSELDDSELEESLPLAFAPDFEDRLSVL